MSVLKDLDPEYAKIEAGSKKYGTVFGIALLVALAAALVAFFGTLGSDRTTSDTLPAAVAAKSVSSVDAERNPLADPDKTKSPDTIIASHSASAEAPVPSVAKIENRLETESAGSVNTSAAPVKTVTALRTESPRRKHAGGETASSTKNTHGTVAKPGAPSSQKPPAKKAARGTGVEKTPTDERDINIIKALVN